jgi:hypothetical protein
MLLRIFLLMLFASLLSAEAKAQSSNGCVDSTLIRYGYWCPPDFYPVCGCDNITYRNLCFAQNQGLLSYAEGPCEPIVMDFNPNPVIDVAYLKMVLKQESTVNFWIYDYYGKEYFFQSYGTTKEMLLDLNVNTFPPGIYILIAVTGNGDMTQSKLVKYRE